MGNRAVIAFKDEPQATGIYLHWNGGVESVLAFLDVANELGVPALDENYGLARLVQIIGNFFGGMSSLGIGPLVSLDCDNGDNGLYIVGPTEDRRGLCIRERLCSGSNIMRVDQLGPKGLEYYNAVRGEALDKQPEGHKP